ncbi:MAG: hypothetical protein KBC64_07940 [Simkaniaceae bacterium]|nr:hypothetical protein [Simkaniaceae bacterium]
MSFELCKPLTEVSVCSGFLDPSERYSPCREYLSVDSVMSESTGERCIFTRFTSEGGHANCEGIMKLLKWGSLVSRARVPSSLGERVRVLENQDLAKKTGALEAQLAQASGLHQRASVESSCRFVQSRGPEDP